MKILTANSARFKSKKSPDHMTARPGRFKSRITSAHFRTPGIWSQQCSEARLPESHKYTDDNTGPKVVLCTPRNINPR